MRLENSSFQFCNDKGVDVREGADVDLVRSSFFKCNIAIHMQEGSKVCAMLSISIKIKNDMHFRLMSS